MCLPRIRLVGHEHRTIIGSGNNKNRFYDLPRYLHRYYIAIPSFISVWGRQFDFSPELKPRRLVSNIKPFRQTDPLPFRRFFVIVFNFFF